MSTESPLPSSEPVTPAVELAREVESPTGADPFAALRYAEFRDLISGIFLFTIALLIQEVVVGYTLYLLTRDPLVLGLIGLAEAIPFISLALFGGYLADRREKTTIMRYSMLFIVAGSCLLLWTMLPSTQAMLPRTVLLALIYAVIAALGFARGFLSPAVSALKAFLVPRALYPNSSTWSSVAWQAGAIIGPAAGGLLYAGVGLTNTLVLVIVLLLTALFLFSRIRKRPVSASPEQPREGMWTSLREGIDFVFQKRIILYAVSLDMFSVLFGGVVAILPVFAEDVLHVGAEGLGILRAASSVGAMLTLLACARFPPTHRAWRNLLVAVAGFGVAILVFGLSRNIWLSVAALAVSGAFDSVSVVIRGTILQVLPPDHLRGRVQAVNSIFVSSSNELGAFQAGLSASIFGATRSVLIGGAITLMTVTWVWRRSADLFSVKLD